MYIWLELSWRDFFSCTMSLFFKLWWLILTTFYIPTLFSIGCPGQPCLRDSEKVSFGPVTSGFLPENHLWIWVIRGFPRHFPLLIIFFFVLEIEWKPSVTFLLCLSHVRKLLVTLPLPFFMNCLQEQCKIWVRAAPSRGRFWHQWQCTHPPTVIIRFFERTAIKV